MPRDEQARSGPPGGWLRISARASMSEVGNLSLSDRGAPTLKERKTLDTTHSPVSPPVRSPNGKMKLPGSIQRPGKYYPLFALRRENRASKFLIVWL
jgi:hypothetical protein